MEDLMQKMYVCVTMFEHLFFKLFIYFVNMQVLYLDQWHH